MKQKFKKGDKVRCVSRKENFKIQLNKIYTILGVTDYHVRVDDNGENTMYYPERFELVEKSLSIKVGDTIRLKTLEEFESEFGENWRNVPQSWVNDMDYLLGKEVVITGVGNNTKGNYYSILKGWYISEEMIAEKIDEVIFSIGFNIGDRVRFKTVEEFEEEFGSGWKEKIDYSWNFSGNMDYLHGEEFTITGISEKLVTGHDTKWSVSTDMLVNITKGRVSAKDTPFLLEPGQKVTIAGIKGNVSSSTGSHFILTNTGKNNVFFKELFIEDPHTYVESIVGYETERQRHFPEVKTIEDLTKVYLALKAREKELESAPRYYKFTSSGYEPIFTKVKVYKIANPLNIEAESNFADNCGNPNGFSGENHKYFTPATEEEWKEQEDCWEIVEKSAIPEESYEMRTLISAKALDIFDLSTDYITVEKPEVEHITDIFNYEV